MDFGVGVASGTDALILALEAQGIGPGDEVITTPFTFFATAEAISRCGATPVFVDIDPSTYNIDWQLLEPKITARTKAIMPVHLFGQSADMESLVEIAQRYDLKVVEDACQAIGAEYKGRRVGGLGDAGCFSFFPSKNLGGAGDGGMVVLNDGELAEKMRLLREHGSSRKYHHQFLGHNSRLDALQAAFLLVKLKYLDEWNKERRELAAHYSELLGAAPEIKTPEVLPGASPVFNLYVIRTSMRETLREVLTQAGVATGIYYPLPLHLQEVYRDLGYEKGELPQSENAAQETLALPLYPCMPKETVEKVSALIIDAITKGRAGTRSLSDAPS